MSIYEKLSNIQEKLIVTKDQYNKFGDFTYRSCEDILNKLKPICRENKVVLFLTNNLVCMGNRVYVEASAILTDLETGEQIKAVAHAREEEVKKGMDGSQITGSSSSYARKYALSGLFNLDDEKDSDALEPTDTLPLVKAKTNADWKKDFIDLGADIKKMEEYFGKPFEQLTNAELHKAYVMKKKQLEGKDE